MWHGVYELYETKEDVKHIHDNHSDKIKDDVIYFSQYSNHFIVVIDCTTTSGRNKLLFVVFACCFYSTGCFDVLVVQRVVRFFSPP